MLHLFACPFKRKGQMAHQLSGLFLWQKTEWSLFCEETAPEVSKEVCSSSSGQPAKKQGEERSGGFLSRLEEAISARGKGDDL